MSSRCGPLAGVRVLEFEAVGPVPMAGMMLSDLGADVVRIDRPQAPDMGVERDARFQFTARGRRSVLLDLKNPADIETALALASRADILLEGLRPGVMERMGLGPDECLARNARLVYGRMTGWGQTGPLASSVGHDINYIGLTGVLHATGEAGKPPAVPLNLIGDFGGGAMLLALGVVSALHEARSSGKGQVVDAAMVDGSLSLMAAIFGNWQAGYWKDERQSNWLDGGAHFYTTYATSDGKAVAVGAIEPRFYQALIDGLGVDPATLSAQHDRSAWPAMRAQFAQIFLQHTRDHWSRLFEGTEACVTPVLSLAELQGNAHLKQRSCFVDVDGAAHPAPSPRFSRTPGAVSGPPPARGEGGAQALQDWGVN